MRCSGTTGRLTGSSFGLSLRRVHTAESAQVNQHKPDLLDI